MHTIAWKKLTEENIKIGWRRLKRKTFRLPNGVEDEWTVLGDSQVSCIFAVTSDLQVICATQFRPGPEKICTDMPGGGVDDGETPKAAAARELLEETGYKGTLIHISSTHNDSYSGAIHHHFLALDCKKAAEPNPGEHECIKVELLSIQELLANIYAGKINDAATALFGLRELQKRGLLKSQV